jgi:hypothetical protein
MSTALCYLNNIQLSMILKVMSLYMLTIWIMSLWTEDGKRFSTYISILVFQYLQLSMLLTLCFLCCVECSTIKCRFCH